MSLGLSREMIEGPPTFVPLAPQAAFAESVARQLGERHLGPILVNQYGYRDLGIYAAYVLEAPRLDIAGSRGRRALPFRFSSSILCAILTARTGVPNGWNY